MNSSKNGDHREFSRVPVRLEARVNVGEESVVSSETRNISMRGLLVCCEKKFPVGAECEIALVLAGAEIPISVQLKGQVQRVDDTGMAIQFSEIGLDSYQHLQNLVMYNSGDAHQVEKEKGEHLGLKKKE